MVLVFASSIHRCTIEWQKMPNFKGWTHYSSNAPTTNARSWDLIHTGARCRITSQFRKVDGFKSLDSHTYQRELCVNQLCTACEVMQIEQSRNYVHPTIAMDPKNVSGYANTMVIK